MRQVPMRNRHTRNRDQVERQAQSEATFLWRNVREPVLPRTPTGSGGIGNAPREMRQPDLRENTHPRKTDRRIHTKAVLLQTELREPTQAAEARAERRKENPIEGNQGGRLVALHNGLLFYQYYMVYNKTYKYRPNEPTTI